MNAGLLWTLIGLGWTLGISGWGAFILAAAALSDIVKQRDELASRYIAGDDLPAESRYDYVIKITDTRSHG